MLHSITQTVLLIFTDTPNHALIHSLTHMREEVEHALANFDESVFDL